MAPVLAHCGIAAFVHDKRGTGDSQGVYRDTTYDDHIRDTRNLAVALSRHARIEPARVGTMGASEGGRIAVLARDLAVAVIPRCGHVPVDAETKQRVRFEHLILNWLDENVAAIPDATK